MLLHCGAVCGGGVKKEQCRLLSGLSFTSPVTHKQIGPFWCWFQVGGFLYVLGPCGSLQQTLLWGWEFFPLPQSPQVFSVRGFEALFPYPGTPRFVVCLAPQLFLPVYPHTNVGLPSLTATAFRHILSTPPTGLDECFFFNSFDVRIPRGLIFWWFWLFFVFKFVVVLLVVQGGKVYLPMPPSCPEVSDVRNS